jgi:single-strand DNA-binding protein
LYDTNNITIIGRLTRDPETSYTKTNKQICKFSIANSQGNDNTSFFNIIAWEKTASTCEQYLKKGSQVAINGSLVQNRWQDENGQNRSAVQINAKGVQFIGGRTENQNANPGQQQAPQQMTGQPQQGFQQQNNNIDLSGQSMGNNSQGNNEVPF